MDTLVAAVRNLFGFVTGVKPQFRAHGGSVAENLALQNIQVSNNDMESLFGPVTYTYVLYPEGEASYGSGLHVCPVIAVGAG